MWFIICWLLLSVGCLIATGVLIMIDGIPYNIKTGGIINIDGLNLRVDKVKILYGPTFDTVIIYGFPLIRKVSGVRELMNGTNVNVVNSKSGIHIKMMAANISIVSRTRTVTIIQIDNNMFYSKYNGSVPKVPQRL